MLTFKLKIIPAHYLIAFIILCVFYFIHIKDTVYYIRENFSNLLVSDSYETFDPPTLTNVPQIENPNYAPDNGNCSPAEFCGGIYKSKLLTNNNKVNPPNNKWNDRVNYYNIGALP